MSFKFLRRSRLANLVALLYALDMSLSAFLFVYAVLLGSDLAWAEESPAAAPAAVVPAVVTDVAPVAEAAPTTSSVTDVVPAPGGGADAAATSVIDSAPLKKKRYVSREKEFEGTQAPNRFEGDPVVKSKYQLGGQALEVDPD